MNKKLALLALSLFSLSGAAQAALYDRGGGLIYDNVLNVTWLQDANYGAGSSYDNGGSTTDGRMTWGNAVAWAESLSYYDSVRNVTYTDWRLPVTNPVNGVSFNYNIQAFGGTDVGYNISAPGTDYSGSTASEMAYMFYVNLGNPGYVTPAGVISGCYVNSGDTCLDNVGPFTNLQPEMYWSGSSYPLDTSYAWYFNMSVGDQGPYRSSDTFAWAVRDGDVSAVPEPTTSAMMLASLGLLGFVAQRRKQKQATV